MGVNNNKLWYVIVKLNQYVFYVDTVTGSGSKSRTKSFWIALKAIQRLINTGVDHLAHSILYNDNVIVIIFR